MGKQELDAFFAGMVEARGTAYVKHLAGRRRAHLEVMFRDRGPAESFQEHFGGVYRITRETPRYRRDLTNHVYFRRPCFPQMSGFVRFLAGTVFSESQHSSTGSPGGRGATREHADDIRHAALGPANARAGAGSGGHVAADDRSARLIRFPGAQEPDVMRR
jgi:hypothetical protein